VDAIWELRLVCHLDFDVLAPILHADNDEQLVSWAHYATLPPETERHILRVLETVRTIDRGYSYDIAALLLGDVHGEVPMDLLRAGKYQRVVDLLGVGPGRPRSHRETRTAEELRSLGLAPLPPWVLVDARHEKIHRDIEEYRVVKIVRYLGDR